MSSSRREVLFRAGTLGRAAVALVAATGAACLPAPEEAPRAVARAERPQLPAPAPASAAHPMLTEQVLPSGMHILLDEDPHTTLAGVVSVVRGGAGLDPPGSEGLAHLVEHLTYRAVDPVPPARGWTAERPASRWDRLIRYATAEMNGHTTPDCLLFYEVAPAARLGSLLDLEAARLADPLVGVDEATFAVERQVIGNEHLVRSDARAGGWPASALFPLLFPSQHPYSRPAGGTDESRRKLTLADARAYAARSFLPERMTLLVTAPPGAISLAAIAAALPAALRGDQAHPHARAAPAPPGAPATGPHASAAPAPDAAATSAVAGPVRVERRGSPLPAPELWIGWTLPGAFGELGPAGQVLQSWVHDDLRVADLSREDAHIRHASAWLQPGADASVLFVRTLVADGADAEHVAQVVVARVASLWAREPTSRDDFARLRDGAQTQRMLDEPTQLPRAVTQAMWAAMTNRASRMADMLASIQSVPSSSVARLAYQHLTRAAAHAVLFTPSAPAGPGHAALPAARVVARGTEGGELVAGATSWDLAELDRLLPPAPNVTVKKLATGLTVLTVPRPGTAAVAWLGFRGGYSDADPPLLVELAVRARPDASQATKLHILPGRGATRNLSFETVEFLPAQLPDALTLLFAKAVAPVREWPTHEGLERLLAPVTAAEDPQTHKADRGFWRALFGDHAYARVLGTDDLDKITRADIDAWVGRVHNARNAVLIVVGDVTAAEVERGAAILSPQIRGPAWVADLPTPPAPAFRPASAERMVPVVTPRPGALTDVRVGCLLPPLTAAERGAYELLGHAIGARLNTAMRMEQGDGYGVGVGVERLRGATYLVASTMVDDQILARTLAVLRDHWQRWSSVGFDASEINVARWSYAGQLAATYGDANALALTLLDDWNAEPAALGTGSLRPQIAGARAARVNELFATCKANAVLGLTGNEALIHGALERAWPALAAARHP